MSAGFPGDGTILAVAYDGLIEVRDGIFPFSKTRDDT